MKLFNFLKGETRPYIDISDYKFTSSNHIRYENGDETGRIDDCWRGIKIERNTNEQGEKYLITIHNIDADNRTWGNNIQMTTKKMKVVDSTNQEILLKGYGKDELGNSFKDYGLKLCITKGEVEKIVLYMYDRNIEVQYLNKFKDLSYIKQFRINDLIESTIRSNNQRVVVALLSEVDSISSFLNAEKKNYVVDFNSQLAKKMIAQPYEFIELDLSEFKEQKMVVNGKLQKEFIHKSVKPFG